MDAKFRLATPTGGTVAAWHRRHRGKKHQLLQKGHRAPGGALLEVCRLRSSDGSGGGAAARSGCRDGSAGGAAGPCWPQLARAVYKLYD